MNSLDFTKMKKKYLTVTLADEKETKLSIGMPTKKIMDELINLKSALESFETDNTNTEALDDLYFACSKIMSRNREGVKITKEFLEDLFDVEDVITIFQAYMSFIGEMSESKN